MNNFVALSLLVVLVVGAIAQDNRPKLTLDVNENRFKDAGGSGKQQTFKLSQDAWVSKNGNWRAGGYVQHDRGHYNGQKMRNTHGGLQITGRF